MAIKGTSDLQGSISNSTGSVTVNDAFAVTDGGNTLNVNAGGITGAGNGANLTLNGTLAALKNSAGQGVDVGNGITTFTGGTNSGSALFLKDGDNNGAFIAVAGSNVGAPRVTLFSATTNADSSNGTVSLTGVNNNITGAANINTTGAATTTIGNASSATSIGGTLAVTGATTLNSTTTLNNTLAVDTNGGVSAMQGTLHRCRVAPI